MRAYVIGKYVDAVVDREVHRFIEQIAEPLPPLGEGIDRVVILLAVYSLGDIEAG